MIRSIQRALSIGAFAAGMSYALTHAADDGEMVIGIRREKSATPVIRSANTKEWFKPGLPDAALHTDVLAASRILATTKELSDADDLKVGLLREKDRCAKEFLWMLNWNNCGDPVLRRGAVAGLALCKPEPKVAGKALAISAVYEQDAETRAAVINLIKARNDAMAAKTLVETWKSAFDDVGLLKVNEPVRKAAVNAIHDVGDKRVYQALLYYAMLEVRAGAAELVRVDSVAITGQRINLPIDLPVLELRGVEGTIVVPAMASLKQATGQDFGRHFDKWNDWIAKQP